MAILYIEVGFPITYPRSLSELILIYLSVPKLHYFSVFYVIWVLFLCLKVLLFENSNSSQHTPPLHRTSPKLSSNRASQELRSRGTNHFTQDLCGVTNFISPHCQHHLERLIPFSQAHVNNILSSVVSVFTSTPVHYHFLLASS